MRFNDAFELIGSQVRVTCADSRAYTGLLAGIDWDIDTISGVDELCIEFDRGVNLSLPLDEVTSIVECP